jgi:hypothetical protein
MNSRRILPILVLVGLSGSAVAAGQESSEAIPDWPAPATWSPPRAHGVTTAGSAAPLPFLRIAPCNGFTGPYGPPSIGANTQRTFAITGQCGIPQVARAVSFNFTALNVSAAGDLRVFPAGGSVPTVSTLNYNANTPNIANAAIVGLGSLLGSAGIQVQADAATIDLVIDVNGYYAYSATGFANTFLGDSAGFSTTGGDDNTAIGSGALISNATGNNNTAIGASALSTATTGNNTAVGNCALCSSIGSDNIGIGYQAGANQTGSGSHNIYIGNLGVNGESSTPPSRAEEPSSPGSAGWTLSAVLPSMSREAGGSARTPPRRGATSRTSGTWPARATAS